MKGVRAARAALAVVAIVAAGAILLSGGSDTDPRTPPALPGLPPPFLGTAVTGDGGMTAAVDAYGDIVNLYAPGPAGAAMIANPSARQAAGTVPSDTGIVPRLRVGGGPALPLWRAESVWQTYVRGTNAVRTVARFASGAVATVTAVARGEELAVLVGVAGAGDVQASLGVNVAAGVDCRQGRRTDTVALLCRRDRPGIGGVNAGEISSGAAREDGADPSGGSGGDESRRVGDPKAAVSAAVAKAAVLSAAGDRHWLAQARPLGAGSPAWARSMYGRSLLTLRALTGRGGAAAADPVPGRGPQGDEAGWVAAAEQATDIDQVSVKSRERDDNESIRAESWRNLPDYQEGAPADYLGNAIAAAGAGATSADGPKTLPLGALSARRRLKREGVAIGREFGTTRGLVRVAGDPASGLDSAAAWAVRPFALRALYPQARKTLLRLASRGTRFGITPGEGWTGGEDPWTAPTAGSAWALAGLAREEDVPPAATDRRAALGLLEDLRRAATPAGALPERVSVDSGLPRSTTPLLWSSALTILALHELWPTHPG